MIEDEVNNLIRVQQSVLELLEIHGQLYDRQREQLHKIQEDLTRVQEQFQYEEAGFTAILLQLSFANWIINCPIVSPFAGNWRLDC